MFTNTIFTIWKHDIYILKFRLVHWWHYNWFLGLFLLVFSLSSVNMDNSSIQDDCLDFKLFITDHKRLKRGSITASHWITDTLKIWLRTEPVHKGLMLLDIITEIRPSTMYCKYYCNVYFSPFMWKWCILTIYLQKVYFVLFMYFWLTWCLWLLNLYLVCLYVCTLHLNLLYDVKVYSFLLVIPV